MLIEFVVRTERDTYPIVVKKDPCGPGVFGKDKAGRSQHLQGTDGYIAKVADGCGHQDKSRHAG